ncbi:MAG: hypothetical protein ABJA98_16555 [Acidobacteriota bacterium]
MESQTLGANVIPGATAPSRSVLVHAVLVFSALAALLISLRGILPIAPGLALLAVLVWFAVPGVVLARRLYGAQPGGWPAALLLGPAWGYVLSSLVLLALWAAGVRSGWWLVLAPIPATIAVLPAGRLAGTLSVPRLDRRDIGACALVLLAVPAIVGLPYAHVGIDLPEGRAYRAYFTADFVWEMAVVAEVAKGDMPPRNPYYLGDPLHYYWLMHLLPSAEHRAVGRALTIEQLLLVNALWSGLAFAGFFYFFVRQFVDRPWAAATACVGVLFCSSFEGIEQIWSLWQRGRSFEALRYLNIDAMTRWAHQSLPIDGLHRLLLYQPQHQFGYLFGFCALLLLIQARDRTKPALLFVVGLFLAMAMLMSSFAAVMLAIVVAAYEGWSLLSARQWKALVPCALAAAAPMLAAFFVIDRLGYTDAGTKFMAVGVNPLAFRSWELAIFLSFGPVLLVAAGGLATAAWCKALPRFLPIGITLTMCTVFYFLVDVPDVQGVYVGWHVGKVAFVALATLCGFALQEGWARGGWARALTTGLAGIVALAALPTVLIDLYNTQDVWNRAMGPGFRWTVLVTPDELKGLAWINENTYIRARVQVEPTVRGRDTWAYVPAFAERRMSAGLPISMIPLAKYEKSSEDVRTLYRSTSAAQAYELSVKQCIDYLVIGQPERDAYPRLQPLIDASSGLFVTAFKNDTLAVYLVSRDASAPNCPR